MGRNWFFDLQFKRVDKAVSVVCREFPSASATSPDSVRVSGKALGIHPTKGMLAPCVTALAWWLRLVS